MEHVICDIEKARANENNAPAVEPGGSQMLEEGAAAAAASACIR